MSAGVTSLEALDPAADYSRSAQQRAADERWAAKYGTARIRDKRTEATTVDIPFWTAPRGYCRWCGQDVGARRRDGQLHQNLRWHGACADTYRDLSDPAWQRRTAWLNSAGRCVDCPTAALPLRPPLARFDRYDVAAFPLGPWGEGAWEADHAVALIDGGRHEGQNLVLRCVAHHRAKTAQEATARATRRRAAEPSVGEPTAALFDVREVVS